MDPEGSLVRQRRMLLTLMGILLLTILIIILGGIAGALSRQQQQPTSARQQPSPGTSRQPTLPQPEGQNNGQSPVSTEQQQARVEEFIDDGFAFQMGDTRAEIIEHLGQPEREVVTEVRNRHDPEQTDRIHTLYYEGITVELYRVSANGREFLRTVTITSAKYPLRYNLEVGTPVTHITDTLGEPNEQTSTTLTYNDNEGLDRVIFTESDDKISQVRWRYYVD